MTRNHDWYNSNAQKSWPLDDAALLTDDNGQFLPFDIVVDMHLKFPKTAGDRAYLGVVYCGPAAVSVLIYSDTGILLASFTQAKPIDENRAYVLESLLPGVGGWIVFGNGANDRDNINMRFSTPAQSTLLASVARRYRQPPVKSMGLLYSEPGLNGLIDLEAGNDISLTLEDVNMDGQHVQGIVFRLKNSQDNATRNIYEIYAGPCGARPESGNCGTPEPITLINTVTPDCCGNLFLEFRGCAIVDSVINDTRGATIECAISIADVCVTPSRLPDASGRLPNDYDDQCETHDDPDDGLGTTTTTSPGWFFFGAGSSAIEGLPWDVSFSHGTYPDMSIVSGDFHAVTGTSGGDSGLAGYIDIIIPAADPGDSTTVFDMPHHMVAGYRYGVSGNSASAYNVPTDVVAVADIAAVTSSIAYTADGDGGIWFRLGNTADWPRGGYIGSVTAGTLFGPGIKFTTGEPHGLVVGDFVTVFNSSVPGYNTRHEVIFINSATSFSVDSTWTSNSTGGYYSKAGAGFSESITSIASNDGGSSLLCLTTNPHGLAVGDSVLLLGTSDTDYLGTHTVTRVISSTQFVLGTTYAGSSSGGLFKVVEAASGDSMFVLESSQLDLDLILWDTGAPEETNWKSWNMEVAAEFAILSSSTGLRHSAGLALNYTSGNYISVEVDGDRKELRVWNMNATPTLLARSSIPDWGTGHRLRLVATIVESLSGPGNPAVRVSLSDLSTGTSRSLGPVMLPNYSPTTGKHGLFADQSHVWFERMEVWST